MKVTEFIRQLPKAELHLHLEGALPWDMTRAYALEPLPPSPVWWADGFCFTDFQEFLGAMAVCYRHVLTSIDRYQEGARAVFNNLSAQNVRHVEISFSLEWAIAQGLYLPDLVDAIKEVAPANLSICVIGGLSRETQHDLSDNVLEAVFLTPNLDGLDLHGDETKQGPAPFESIFRTAQQKGLLTKAHAGELVGSHSIIDTLNLLNVNRIEHGTTARTDPALLRRLSRENITLDMCPWSNVKLNVVPHITQHPIKEFLKQGINVTVNTDDPSVFGYSLTQELQSLVDNLAFSPAELVQLQKNALAVAKMPPAQKEAILVEMDTLLANWHSRLARR